MDFSRGIVKGYLAVVIPVETGSKMWYFTYPFTNTVWILIATVIPVYVIAMAGADYLYSGSAKLSTLLGFVIRNVLTDQNNGIPGEKKDYKKLLIMVWLLATLVLVQAFAGSLTAMLTNPKLKVPIKTLEQLVTQNEISWVLEEGSDIQFFMRSELSKINIINSIYKGANTVPRLTRKERAIYGGCYAAKMKGNGKVASFCHANYIWPMMANDFTSTGRCNFYLVEEKLLTSWGVAAFQVINNYP